MKSFCIALLIFVLILIGCSMGLVETNAKEGFDNFLEQPQVYCLMVTGKDDQRLALAQLSVRNFQEQDYTHKNLVIVNHSRSPVLTAPNSFDNVIELRVEKTNNIKLGDLRNIALAQVPEHAYWTTWDDDDWRSPQYLSTMMASVNKHMTVVAITKRYEFNLNTKFAWIAEKQDGFVLFVAPKLNNIKYDSKDTMEDMNILSHMREQGCSIITLLNSPSMYIRLVHQNNTSLYVSPQKSQVVQTLSSSVNYVEHPIDEYGMTLIAQIISSYYKENVNV